MSVALEKLPPQALEAEEYILGGLIMDGGEMPRAIATGIGREDFYVKAHGEIWDCLVRLHRDRRPVDLLTVINWLQDEQLLEKVGGMPKLSKLVDQTISTVNLEEYCQLVRSKAALRSLIKFGQDIAAIAYQPKADPATVIEKARLGIRKVSESWLGDGEGELTPLPDLLDMAFGEIEEAIANRDNPDWRGEVRSGFTDLDKHCVGFAPKDLIVIGGRPGSGKTTLMQNLALNIARDYGPVLSFHFGELDKSIITKRIISQQSGVGLTRLRNGQLFDEDVAAVVQGIERANHYQVAIDDQPRDMDSVRDAIDRWQNRYDKQPKAIFLDYVQIIRGRRGNRHEVLEEIMQEAKHLAGDMACPVFIGSQLNRDVEGRNDKRPILADLKSCGGIEEKAQHVLLLYRDAYYNPDTPTPNITEVNVAKCNNGEPGLVKLYSAMETFKFGNLQQEKSYAMGPV